MHFHIAVFRLHLAHACHHPHPRKHALSSRPPLTSCWCDGCACITDAGTAPSRWIAARRGRRGATQHPRYGLTVVAYNLCAALPIGAPEFINHVVLSLSRWMAARRGKTRRHAAPEVWHLHSSLQPQPPHALVRTLTLRTHAHGCSVARFDPRCPHRRVLLRPSLRDVVATPSPRVMNLTVPINAAASDRAPPDEPLQGKGGCAR